MKIACSFFYTDDRYKPLTEISIPSFKAFHPDIDVFIFNKENIDNELVLDYTAGYCKYYYASTLFDKGYDKVISLGIDTITCGRLNEFINNDKDVLVSLDFNYGIHHNGIPVDAHQHFNGDVVCFNNKKFLDDLLKIMKEETISQYLEQGVLSQILFIQPNIYSYEVIDSHDKEAVYNCRVYYSDVNYGSPFNKNYPYPFRVVENNSEDYIYRNIPIGTKALMNPLNKIVKVIHLVRGFGAMDKGSFINDVNTCKGGMFNDETKQFFIENCGIEKSWFDTRMEEKDWPESLSLFEGKTQAGFPTGRKIKVSNDENLLEKFEKKFKK